MTTRIISVKVEIQPNLSSRNFARTCPAGLLDRPFLEDQFFRRAKNFAENFQFSLFRLITVNPFPNKHG